MYVYDVTMPLSSENTLQEGLLPRIFLQLRRILRSRYATNKNLETQKYKLLHIWHKHALFQREPRFKNAFDRGILRRYAEFCTRGAQPQTKRRRAHKYKLLIYMTQTRPFLAQPHCKNAFDRRLIGNYFDFCTRGMQQTQESQDTIQKLLYAFLWREHVACPFLAQPLLKKAFDRGIVRVNPLASRNHKPPPWSTKNTNFFISQSRRCEHLCTRAIQVSAATAFSELHNCLHEEGGLALCVGVPPPPSPFFPLSFHIRVNPIFFLIPSFLVAGSALIANPYMYTQRFAKQSMAPRLSANGYNCTILCICVCRCIEIKVDR